MHQVLANYTLPTVLSSLKPPTGIGAKTVARARDTTGTTTGSSGTAADSIGSTFLSLLSSELQNQDPTAPVDSTAMVGQMISLNQLDQLISINQGITGTATGTTGLVQKPAATSSDTAAATTNGGLANTLSPSVAGAVANQLPFDPTTLMPLGFGNVGAVAASINSSINPATMSFSGANNNTSGGK